MLELPNLSVLDIQSNRIRDVNVVEILAQMPELKVLYLQGNDVVKHIKQYRKTLVYRCRKLKYLDDRPVFDDERRRVDAWGRALEASDGDYKAAQEAEREEMDAIRREKKERDDLNFLHFEQMMLEGRRKRKEEEEAAAKKKREAEKPEETDERAEVEVSAFSGERILPVQDCAFVQREREKRWELVVNAGVSEDNSAGAADGNPSSNQEDEEDEEATSVIPVDARRLELLHQCATVGSGAYSSKDAFVDSSFAAARSSAEDAERKQKNREKAHAKVQELKARKALAEARIPAATQLIHCSSVHLLKTPSAQATEKQTTEAQQPLMPPPAPAPLHTQTRPARNHTNVDELD